MSPLSQALLRWLLFGALALGTLLPFAVLILVSFSGGWFWPELIPSRLTGEHWQAWFEGRGRLGEALWGSVILALGTGLLSVLVGLPAGRAMARLRGWRRPLAAGAAFLPVAAPPLALGVGLQVTLLSLGLGGTHTGVLLAHLVPAGAYVSLFLLGIFAVRDERPELEARTLGATPLQTFLHITLPSLRRPLGEGFALGFLVSWAQLPLTLLIGQGVVATLPMEVLSLVRAGQDARAATGAILLVIPPLALLALIRWLAPSGRTVVVA
jgi:putative spermidine/putrescine transport system permease protein